MDKRVKRVIAREGLVVISLLATSALALICHYWQLTKVSPHRYSERQLDDVIDRADFAEPDDAKNLARIPDKQLLDSLKTPSQEKPLFYRINFLVIAVLLAVVAYPLYLLTRFIAWSVITLKGK